MAIATASITGSVRVTSPVISTTGQRGQRAARGGGEHRAHSHDREQRRTLNFRAGFQADEAAGLTASWEIHARDIVLHAVVTDGKLEFGVGPAPVKPDLVITATLADDELPSYRAIIRAARCGLVELSGRRKLLDTFLCLFAVAQVV